MSEVGVMFYKISHFLECVQVQTQELQQIFRKNKSYAYKTAFHIHPSLQIINEQTWVLHPV